MTQPRTKVRVRFLGSGTDDAQCPVCLRLYTMDSSGRPAAIRAAECCKAEKDAWRIDTKNPA